MLIYYMVFHNPECKVHFLLLRYGTQKRQRILPLNLNSVKDDKRKDDLP